MLDLHRLRLLRELGDRGTIAAVAGRCSTPPRPCPSSSRYSSGGGVRLLERRRTRRAPHRRGARPRRSRGGAPRARRARRVRPRAASGKVAGRARIASFQSAAFHLAVPAMQDRSRARPTCGASSSRRSRSRRAPPFPRRGGPRARRRVAAPAAPANGRHRPGGPLVDPVLLVLPARHPAAPVRARGAPLAELADAPWTTGHRETAVGVEDDSRPHLPRARRVRAGHPPPDERQRHEPGPRGHGPGGHDAPAARAPGRLAGVAGARSRMGRSRTIFAAPSRPRIRAAVDGRSCPRSAPPRARRSRLNALLPMPMFTAFDRTAGPSPSSAHGSSRRAPEIARWPSSRSSTSTAIGLPLISQSHSSRPDRNAFRSALGRPRRLQASVGEAPREDLGIGDLELERGGSSGCPGSPARRCSAPRNSRRNSSSSGGR